MSVWNAMTATDPGGAPPQLFNAARQAFMTSMQAAFTTMLAKLDDALFELAQSADGDLERGNYFDAIRDLRLGRATIHTRFIERLTACWRGLERGDGPAQRQIGGQDRAEIMALTAAVRRAETECADALREVRDGLALTVGVPDGDDTIGPRQVFAAFETACRDTPADPAVRLVVLKFFERHVGIALPGIYRAVAAALVTPAPGPSLSLLADDQPPLDAKILPGDGGAADDLDLTSLIQRAIAGSGDGLAGGEAMKLLATLKQHDAPGARSRSASIDLARVATRPAEPAPNELSQQMVLDMVALLFDSLFTDGAVPVSARLQIARLQIPFLRLALRDRAVLARRSHLGRRFFDQLIAVTRGWQEPLTPQQRDVLGDLIDSVGEACMDDHRAFAAAAERGLTDLRTLSLPAPDTDDAPQAYRKSLAVRAEKELAERCRQIGRVPDPIDAFLQSHWLQYLVDCMVRHGADGSPWRQALATLDALLWSLSPKEGAGQQRLAELRPRLIRRLRQGMDQVGVSMFDQEAFLETLDEVLDRAQAGQPIWDWQEENAIDDLLGTEPPTPAPVASVVELAAELPPLRLVTPAEPPRVIPPVAPTDASAEELVTVEDLADEFVDDETPLLELPMAPADIAAMVDEEIGEQETGEEVEAPVLDATPPDSDDDPGVIVDEIEADADYEVSAVDPADDVADDPADRVADPGVLDERAAPSAPEPPANTLEALLRRRGLKTVAQVEEVEVTERGAGLVR